MKPYATQGLRHDSRHTFWPITLTFWPICPNSTRPNTKKGPTEVGPSQVQLRRISAQLHRCNGKSFQYPPNVIIFLIIYFCGSAIQLFLYLTIMLVSPHSASRMLQCSYFFHFVRGDDECNTQTVRIVRYRHRNVHSNTDVGVSFTVRANTTNRRRWVVHRTTPMTTDSP